MVSKVRVLAGLALGAALLSRRGRERLAALPGALRRDPTRLPRGVQEFPATFVDKRQAADAQPVPPAAGADAATIAAEYYQEHPAG